MFRLYKITDPKSLGDRLSIRRTSLGLSLRDMEKECELSTVTLRNLEMGKRVKIYAYQIEDLSAVYKLNQEYLIELMQGKIKHKRRKENGRSK